MSALHRVASDGAAQAAPGESLAKLAGHRSNRVVDEVYRCRVRPSEGIADHFDWLR